MEMFFERIAHTQNLYYLQKRNLNFLKPSC